MPDLMYQGHAVSTAAISNVTTKAEQVADPGDNFKIIVLSYTLTLDANGQYQWEAGTDDLTGLVEVTADTPVVSNTPMVCTASEALNLTATQAANGHFSYIVVADP